MSASSLHPVILHGALAARFGERFMLAVASPAEAVRALMFQVRGFRQAISAGQYTVLRRKPGHRVAVLESRELGLGMGPGEEVHLVPVVAGAGDGDKKNIGKIILGAALVAGAMFFAPAGMGLGATAIEALGMTFGDIALFGGSLILGGISSMLAPKPKVNVGNTEQRKQQNFLFDGPAQRTEQGPPVQVVYGRMTVGSALISGGIDVRQETALGRSYETLVFDSFNIGDFWWSYSGSQASATYNQPARFTKAVTMVGSPQQTWRFEYGLRQTATDTGVVAQRSCFAMSGGVSTNDGQAHTVPFAGTWFQTRTGWREGTYDFVLRDGAQVSFVPNVYAINYEPEVCEYFDHRPPECGPGPMPALGMQWYARMKRVA